MTRTAPDNPLAHAAGGVTAALSGWPPLLANAILIAGALLLAIAIHAVIFRLIPHRLRDPATAFGAIVSRARGIVRAFLAVVFLAAVVPQAPLGQDTKYALLHGLSAGIVLLIGWTALVAIDGFTLRQLSHRPDDIQSDVEARRHVTQWQVLRRVAHVLAVIVTVAAALMVFPAVRDFGVSLLASAGAAGLVLGLAARPVLSNLIAGIQIAITQPLRVEDAVVINGQWGWVEEITATYVVVRIWNWQRLVVPLAWLLEQPFQNWTRESAELIGDVFWNVDYTVPVEAMRRKLEEIVHATPLWTGKVVVLQVTDSTERTLQLRALVSARNSGDAWDLRCHVRERMIAFLQQEYPHALPKQRVGLDTDAAPGGAGRADAA